MRTKKEYILDRKTRWTLMLIAVGPVIGIGLAVVIPLIEHWRDNMPQSTKDVSIEGLTSEGYKFLDGSLVEWPEKDSGTIRTRDQDGNHLETYEPGDDDYDNWKSYFKETDSEKRRREYMDAGCKVCLYCKSENTDNGDIDWDEPLGIRVSCADCGKTWTDLYTTIDVVED